ncbi:MAG: preprotein translocase subunit SecG [Tenericutes bacterium 4572_104]|nr:MAG: preprotein translocase subunit SecG [Tenericutes bacterium 4572_104]
MHTIDFLLFFVSIFLIILVMVQESKDDVNNTFTGEKSDLFKNQKQRGAELVLARVSIATSIAFIGLAILALILY